MVGGSTGESTRSSTGTNNGMGTRNGIGTKSSTGAGSSIGIRDNTEGNEKVSAKGQGKHDKELIE